jgi:hypothetical protein
MAIFILASKYPFLAIRDIYSIFLGKEEYEFATHTLKSNRHLPC